MTYSREYLKESLKKAKKSLGHEPTITEYSNLDFGVSTSTIYNEFGSWNEAKQSVGFNTEQQGGIQKKINESYFKKINSQEKAYWLGFLLGDGCIFENSLKVELKSSDKSHLEKFKEAIDSEHQISEYENEGNGAVSWEVTRKTICDDLRNLKVDENKTNSKYLPNIKKELRCHFVRGLFDADGCSSVPNLYICGKNPKRLRKLSSWIPTDCDVHQSNKVYYLTFSQREDFISWIYPNGKETFPQLLRKSKNLISDSG